jgi:hypothetical protein
MKHIVLGSILIFSVSIIAMEQKIIEKKEEIKENQKQDSRKNLP